MKKLMIGLICAVFFSSCSNSDSGNQAPAGGGGGGGGGGRGVLDLNQPRSTRQFPNEANDIINWELSLMGKSERIRFSGRTTNNFPCELWLTDLRKSGPIETNQFYLSLGTGETATTNYDNFTWIGTFIAPQYEYHDLKITLTQVHFSKTEDAFPGSADYPAVPKHINDLVVFTDSRGLPIKAVGQSSHWPSSTCNLN